MLVNTSISRFVSIFLPHRPSEGQKGIFEELCLLSKWEDANHMTIPSLLVVLEH